MEISPYQDTVQDKPLIPVMPEGGSIVYEKRIEKLGGTGGTAGYVWRKLMDDWQIKENTALRR
ncbi:hypothetical protein ES708_31853 [subsurface metagenome]